jgi:uncharacterized protein (TIGR02391 family)
VRTRNLVETYPVCQVARGLVINDLSDQTDQDEQEGMMHLFAGAVLALRNPRAHALLDDSPEMALEYIALLSMLAKRLEQAKRR